MATRRKLPGFDEPHAKYPKTFPAAHLETHKCVRPTAGDLNHDPVINFKINCAPEETIKFGPEPFWCSYQVHLWDDDANDWKLASVSPFDKTKNPFMLDCNLGAGAFFSECQTSLQNKPVSIGNIGKLNHFLSSFNKSMLNQDLFKKKYGRLNPRIRYTHDQTILLETNKAPDGASDADKQQIFSKNIQAALLNRDQYRLQRAVESLAMDSEQASTFKSSSFGFCCSWPFDAQLNATAVWTGTRHAHGFLPLGQGISVRLLRHNPMTIALERFDCTDANRIDEDASFTEVKIKIEIKDLVLNYVSLVLKNPEQIDKINKTDMVFFQDRLTTQIKNLNPDIKFENFTINLPENCLGVVILFFHQSMLFPNRDKHQTMSAKRRFPKNLKSISFELSGKPGLLASQGLSDLTTANKSQSASLFHYYTTLVKSGLYDEPFHCLAPTHKMSAVSYDDTVFLNFVPFDLKTPQDLILALSYNDSNSKKGWHCASYAVTQTKITFKNGHWDWDETY